MTMITPSDWNDGFKETLDSFLYSRHALILEGLEHEIIELITCSERLGISKAIAKLTEKNQRRRVIGRNRKEML